MATYQNGGEVEPAVIQKSESVFLKYMFILSAVCATGLLAISATTLYPNSLKSSNFKASKKSSTSVTVYSSLSSSEKKSLFEDFKSQFGKEYASDDEESEKYSNFKDFLELVDERNSAEIANGGSALHGITKFADLTDDEFTDHWKGFKLKGDLATVLKNAKNGDDYAAAHSTATGDDAPATAVNWAGVQTTPVKNQGYCGSCWAFSATEQIESDSIKAGYTTTSDALSTQQIVSCDSSDDGCDGGITVYAYYYVYSTGGLESNATYPYHSFMDESEYGGTCESNTQDYQVTVDTYYYLSSESTMASHVLSYGPLSICIDAASWSSYMGGILSTCGDSVDHCVQAVGINQDDGYWIVRNSWGTDWGLDGYIYLEAGVNMCDITYLPTFTEVSRA